MNAAPARENRHQSLRLPSDGVFKNDTQSPPHLGLALSEAWSRLVVNGLIAEVATGLLGVMPS